MLVDRVYVPDLAWYVDIPLRSSLVHTYIA